MSNEFVKKCGLFLQSQFDGIGGILPSVVSLSIPCTISSFYSIRLLGTAETISRFILPMIDCYEAFSGNEVRASFKTLRGYCDQTKEFVCSGHSIKGYRSIKDTLVYNFPSHIVRGWNSLGFEGIAATFAKNLSWLSHVCSTIRHWNPQSYLVDIGSKVIGPHCVLYEVACSIGNTSIYSACLPENIKPWKDRLYASNVITYFIAEGLHYLREPNRLDRELMNDYVMKMAKLVATLAGGNVYFAKNRKVGAASAMVAGTCGMIKLGYHISKIEIKSSVANEQKKK